jgi:putative ABC transport system ATP-binding protein
MVFMENGMTTELTDIIVSTHQLNQEVERSGETEHEKKHNNPLVILNDINISIKRGESLAIVGASGSGKSTLLGLLAGLDTPSSGQIILAGHDITKMNEEQRASVRAEHVGFVFQNFQLLGSLTALENVMLPLEVKGLEKGSNIELRAKELLERVGLSDRMHHTPSKLSGGEQQRVAIARAFASNASILFADEPTGNLDTKTGEKISQLIFDLNQEFGTTLIMVTHDSKLAQRCDRQIEIVAGCVE